MCRVLGVSTSGFYDRFEGPKSLSQQTNTARVLRIHKSFTANDRTYGSARIVRGLRDDGPDCPKNRVARLMQLASIKARHKRRGSQSKANVFDYIEVFYNPTRRHSTLGYVSPIKFEEMLFV